MTPYWPIFSFFLSLMGTNQTVISESEAKSLLAEFKGVETETLMKEFLFAPGLSITTTFKITSKGNGILSIPGLQIRIYDEHNDGPLF